MVVITQGWSFGFGSGFGSGSGIKPIDERLREFIMAKVTRGILDDTPIMFCKIKDGITEFLKE